MIVAGCADRICYANRINGSFLSLKISSYRIYIAAPCFSQYTRRCICEKIDAIGNLLEISIRQIGCKTCINLQTNVIVFYSYKFQQIHIDYNSFN